MNNPLQIGGGSGNYEYLSENTIKEMLGYENSLMQWIFQRLQGITIATEPEHTGGLLQLNKLLNLINNIWFIHASDNGIKGCSEALEEIDPTLCSSEKIHL